MKTCAALRRTIVITIVLTSHVVAYSQKPVIRSIDKTSAVSGEVVTLQGTFNNNVNNVVVYFGASRGSVQFVSDQLLEVRVPSGSTYENIVVADITTGLTDESGLPFLYSFGGSPGITPATMEGQIDFDSESGLYDLCMCDFDNDRKIDIATANDGSPSISILANTTASTGLGNISFNRIPFGLGTRSIHAKCGDLNGDGKPDLVISEGGGSGDKILILRNTSAGAGSFTFAVQSISLTGKKIKRTEISDLDNDGKPEIIVTNQTGGNVTVLINQSTLASIAFATPLTISVPGAASTDGLSVEDLDADGKPDIITTQFLTQTSNVFILKNNSLPGNFTFAPEQTLDLSGTVVNLKTGDLDGDGKPEIAATQLIGSGTVSIFKNESTGSISFATPMTFVTDVRPWGIDFGDFDGDGLADIVVASLEKSISILNNTSTPSLLSFSTVIQSTTYINRHAGMGDIDGDGKPDIVFTSVDDNNNSIPASKISVFRNKTCLVPQIDPAGPIAICTGFPLQLKVAESAGTTYEWRNGASVVANGADAFFDVVGAGSYAVTATSEAGACSETSNSVTVTVDPGNTTGTATPTNDGPVCPGSTLFLAVNDVGGTVYNWTGPNGYTGTGLTPSPIANFQAVNAGRYYVDVVVNGCIAQQTSTVVEMIGVPDFQVTYSGPDVICAPDTKTLSLTPTDPDFTYQWAERTAGNIAGATGTSISVTASGEYFVKAQYVPNPACLAIESQSAAITFSAAPAANFAAPLSACTNQVINFANQSTGEANMTLFYAWTFGDSQLSTLENPTHQYSAADTYSVTLQVSYENGACENFITKDISVQTAPIVAITTPGNDFSVCLGDSLMLEVSGTFSSYQWSTGETTPSIFVTSSGNYGVDVMTGSCIVTAVVNVGALEPPLVTASADPAEVSEGGSSQLTAAGLLSYLWQPSAFLNDATLQHPVATPIETTVFTVQGVDENGCNGTATVELRVKGDFIVNKLAPSKFISPNNGDGINNFWTVGQIENYPQCAVTIYDDKGVKVFDAKPYNNDWDGTYKGRTLPDGVYYYILRCDGEENNPRSGSITVLR